MRKSVRAIGRCAIKVESAAERCVGTLVELIQTKVTYVVQEAVIVIKVRSHSHTYIHTCADFTHSHTYMYMCRPFPPGVLYDILSLLCVCRTSSASTPTSTRASSQLSVRTWTPWTSQRPGQGLTHSPTHPLLVGELVKIAVPSVSPPPPRASMIWILGEYCDRIDSVDELLTTFLDNFTDENSQVSRSILSLLTVQQ